MVVRSFGGERWCPAGPRWVTQIPLTGPGVVDELADAYTATIGSWWSAVGDDRPLADVLEVLPAARRHITVSLIEQPAVETPHEQLAAALVTRLAGCAPIELQLGPAIVNTVAVEVYVAPSVALADLHARVARAYRDIVPDHIPAPAARRYRPHAAIAYARADLDDTGLAGALLRTPGPTAGWRVPITTTVDHVVLAATDPWTPSPNGSRFSWDAVTARAVGLA